MGLLNKENAIVVDAVLTDIGRSKIAKNDGSFKVVGYIFADDEIDYGLYNPSTGSSYVDQNILNTPIFESNVNENLAIKYPLMTIINPNLKYLPNLAVDNASVSVGEEKGQTSGVTLRFYQNTNQNAKIVPADIQDAVFKVEMSNDLLNVEGETPVEVTPYNTALYILKRDAQLIESSRGAQLTFKVRPQSLSNDIWTTLGQGTVGSRTITTSVLATGINSGLSNKVTVVITEELTR